MPVCESSTRFWMLRALQPVLPCRRQRYFTPQEHPSSLGVPRPVLRSCVHLVSRPCFKECEVPSFFSDGLLSGLSQNVQ